MAQDPLDKLLLERQLCFSLYAASRLLTRRYQPLLEPLGLTYPQYLVMLILWQDSPCGVGHIGARALLNTNTLTPLLKRLEQQGYVDRRRGARDERTVDLHLTPIGLALKQQCAHVPLSMAAGVAYSATQAEALKGLLDQLIQQLQIAPAVAANAQP